MSFDRVRSIVPDDREITRFGLKAAVEDLDLLESRALINKLFRETEALYELNSQVCSGFRGKILRLCGINLSTSKPTYHISEFDVQQNAQQLVTNIEKSVFIWRQSESRVEHTPTIKNAIHATEQTRLENTTKKLFLGRLQKCLFLLENNRKVSTSPVTRLQD